MLDALARFLRSVPTSAPTVARADAWAFRQVPAAPTKARTVVSLTPLSGKRDRDAWARGVVLDAIDTEIDQGDTAPPADRLDPAERGALVAMRNRVAKLFRLPERG